MPCTKDGLRRDGLGAPLGWSDRRLAERFSEIADWWDRTRAECITITITITFSTRRAGIGSSDPTSQPYF